MSNADPDQDVLSQLVVSCEFGSDEWHERFASEVHRLVAANLVHQIPARLRPVFSIDDLAQETALRLLAHFERQQAPVEVNVAFVLVVARRVLIDYVRKYLASKRMPQNGFIDIAPTSSMNLLNEISRQAQTPSQVNMGVEFWMAATSLLDQRERELIELKHTEDLSYEEIAEIFGKTPQAIRSLLFRIHKKLRMELSQHPEYESYL